VFACQFLSGVQHAGVEAADEHGIAFYLRQKTDDFDALDPGIIKVKHDDVGAFIVLFFENTGVVKLPGIKTRLFGCITDKACQVYFVIHDN